MRALIGSYGRVITCLSWQHGAGPLNWFQNVSEAGIDKGGVLLRLSSARHLVQFKICTGALVFISALAVHLSSLV